MTYLRRRRPIAVIAEDERLLRDELIGHLAQQWPELAIGGVACDGIQALAVTHQVRPDVVFLDIQMPGLTGIDVARQINGSSHVVFITAYDSHALAAFEHGAVDYLLKPYDELRLGTAIERVQSRLRAGEVAPLDNVLDEIVRLARPKQFLRWIKASVGHDIRLILVDDVCFFQADTKYTTVATAEGDAIIRTSLKALTNDLNPDVFLPIHRSTIVNINAVKEVNRALDGGMHILLKSRPERLSVSESSRHLFRAM